MNERKRNLKLADISFDDHELIDSLTDEEVRTLLLEIYHDDPENLMKHAKIGIKITMGSDAELPEPFWWVGASPKRKDWVQ
jgi:hypothetical protein